MLKVLVIVPTTFGYDGISNIATNYYVYQNHNEVKMDIVTINPVNEKLKSEIKKNGDNFYVLPFRNKKPIKYIYELRQIIKNNGYKIVHVHGCSATLFVEMLASKLAGVKIRIAHSHNTTCNHVKIDKILRPFFQRLCTHGFACGEEAGDWLFNGREFDIISNGIDLKKFTFSIDVRNEFRRKFQLEDKLVIGHVGRFSEQKNHHKLIEIFEAITQRYHNAKLVLIGEGKLKAEIEESVKKKNLDVLFVGPSDEVHKWLQAMDVMVFPSLFEGLPLSIVEAQAAGLPCILSNTISPMTEITDLIEFVDLNATADIWAENVLNIDNMDRTNRQCIVEKQIKSANFDIEINCKNLRSKYKKLLIQ